MLASEREAQSMILALNGHANEPMLTVMLVSVKSRQWVHWSTVLPTILVVAGIVSEKKIRLKEFLCP